MQSIDFSRSFLTWRIDSAKKQPITVTQRAPYDLNTARAQLDCHCEILEKKTGVTRIFALGASCKTERVGVGQGIWNDPNADFVPILSDECFMSIKSYDHADASAMLDPPDLGAQPDRHIVNVKEAFDGAWVNLHHCEAELLSSAEEIVVCTLNNLRLVAGTELESYQYKAVLQYPVKTMNANERDGVYQTDTGPVLFPDLSCSPDRLFQTLQLAFVAFNTSSWAEFIVRSKTEIRDGISVYHYSKGVRCEVVNWIAGLKH